MAPRRPIYLDHHATVPLDPRVLEAMLPFYREDFGNAASRTHVFGWRAEAAVEDARERIAGALGAEPREIVFTSGATESNNLALIGAARAGPASRDKLVAVATEHPAVLDPCRALAREGFAVEILDVAPDGLLDPAVLAGALDDRTRLASVMLANNEIGVVQPLAEISLPCRERGVLLHTDGAQAVGKLPVDVNALGVDLLSISGHKLGGPKGVGALYVRSRKPRVRLEPLLHGGGHERGMRSGTLAVPLIVGLARALELRLVDLAEERRRVRALRDRLWSRLADALDGATLNGNAEQRLDGNLNVTFEGVDADRLLLALPGVALSTGSACSSAKPEPSHVLLAIGLSVARARASIRFGIGRGNTPEEIDEVAERLIEAVRAHRATAPAGVAGAAGAVRR